MQEGDFVLFNIDGEKDYMKGLLTHIGIVSSKGLGTYGYNIICWEDNNYKFYKGVDELKVRHVSEVLREIEKVKERFNEVLEFEKSKLKKVSQFEKDEEKIAKFEDVKKRILANCERMLCRDLDEEDFANRVKEIAQLKKQLYSNEKLSCVSDARKHNGVVKYNIRLIEEVRDKILKRLNSVDGILNEHF